MLPGGYWILTVIRSREASQQVKWSTCRNSRGLFPPLETDSPAVSIPRPFLRLPGACCVCSSQFRSKLPSPPANRQTWIDHRACVDVGHLRRGGRTTGRAPAKWSRGLVEWAHPRGTCGTTGRWAGHLRGATDQRRFPEGGKVSRGRPVSQPPSRRAATRDQTAAVRITSSLIRRLTPPLGLLFDPSPRSL